MEFTLLLIISFFAGSIPHGYLLGKWYKVDVRQHGSGNIGATNVFRVLGKKAGIICFILDFTKGAIPVCLANYAIKQQYIAESQQHILPVLVAIAAVLGHTYTPWLKFKGGKGIATAIGVLSFILPPILLVTVVVIWLAVLLIWRYVSLASVVSAIALPLLYLLGITMHQRWVDNSWNKPLFTFVVIIAVLIVWRHRSNIIRLRQGKEHRIGDSKK